MKPTKHTTMKTKHALCGLLSGLLLLIGGMSTDAAVIVFTDFAAWQAAAGGGPFALDNLNSGTLNRGAYVISGTAQNAFPNSNSTTTIDGSGYLRVLLGSQGAPNSFTLFTFQTPTVGLGYDVNPRSGDLGATVYIAVDGAAVGSYSLPATDANGFRGFISDVPFTIFEIRNNGPETAWHGIDNVLTIVPEPNSLMLLSIALGTLVGFKRKRRAGHNRGSN